jgi:hypothetical protein
MKTIEALCSKRRRIFLFSPTASRCAFRTRCLPGTTARICYTTRCCGCWAGAVEQLESVSSGGEEKDGGRREGVEGGVRWGSHGSLATSECLTFKLPPLLYSSSPYPDNHLPCKDAVAIIMVRAQE